MLYNQKISIKQNRIEEMNIGIVGGGISGITAALYLQRLKSIKKIRLFQANPYFGGRIVQRVNEKQFHLDMGANLIDFETKQIEEQWNHFMSENIRKNMCLVEKPFMLYENNILRKGDYYKERYYYKNGFSSLITDMLSQINSSKVEIVKSSEILNVGVDQQVVKFTFFDPEKQKRQQQFDSAILSCPTNRIQKIVNVNEAHHSIQQLCQKVKHTTQCSLAFKTTSQLPQFSFILFINHPISFISNHHEKYKQNTVVIQMTQKFTKEHQHLSNMQIQQQFLKVMPQDMKKWIETEQLLDFVIWKEALVKSHTNEYKGEGKIICVGDSITKKSRITSTVVDTLKLLSKLQF